MGTNAVRLIRSDHRRISGLLARLDGPHRGGADLPQRIARELSAHVAACRDCLLPFAEARLSLDGAEAESLDELASAAQQLRTGADSAVVNTSELVETMRRHVDAEERHLLQPLEYVANLDRLRRLGEAFRRARDSALRAAGDARRNVRSLPSRAELYEQARYRKIAGRSAMSRAQLLAALKEQS